jgi:chromosome partitioning protein
MSLKVITVAQQKGGAGKTTIAAHLAVALVQKGFKVALIDIDQQRSLSMWYKLREEKFGKGYTGINFISTMGIRLPNELSRLKQHYDIAIIDSPPRMESESKAAIREADVVIVPVQPSPTDLWATDLTMDYIKKEDGKMPYLIFNRASYNSKLATEIKQKLKKSGYQLKFSIGNRVVFASSMMEGRCVTETHPTSIASQEIKNLVNDIVSKINNTKQLKNTLAEVE